jgi:AAA15 family ATPase/GTPase
MILKQITIENYKSIKKLDIPVEGFDQRYFSFLGVNEAGKTSILEAINLKAIHANTPLVYSKHCYRPAQINDEPIVIKFTIELGQDEIDKVSELQTKQPQADVSETTDATQATTTPTEAEATKTAKTDVADKTAKKPVVFGQFVYSYQIDVDSDDSEQFTYFEGEDELEVPEELDEYLMELVPSVEFWRGRENELIPDEITAENIKSKANTPFNNCLQIAGLQSSNIVGAIANGGRQSELGEQLTAEVTSYLNKRWPGHNIKIEFHVADERVTCNVVDTANPGKQRIAPSARSDGFKKLVSFLLSLSVDYEKNEVSDSLLLLDEPEMFLHPEAQQNFRDELIAIASKNNNVVMISTHSMYMIHKKHIDRCFGVEKKQEGRGKEFKTSIVQLSPDVMSFARINYAIFNIPTAEYHSELYGLLHAKLIDETEDTEPIPSSITDFDNHYFPKEKKEDWKRMRGKKEVTEKVSIHSYIRHSIHHPENNLGNKPFDDEQLRSSIKILEEILYTKEKGS